MPSYRPILLLWCAIVAIELARAGFIDACATKETEYDFIIVGGGTAGNVVANRLSENPKHNVLVLEAGPSDAGVLEMQVPFMCTSLAPNTPFDWNYTTTLQTGLGNRAIPYPRGHVLGGSSNINYLVYTRGSAEDYDRYANVTGDQGWSWRNMQQYFRKNERFNQPADGHNATGQFDPEVHSFSGMNSVTLSGYPSAINGRVIEASRQLGGEFGFNLDYNSGSSLGLGWFQMTAGGGKRSSSSTSYLGPPFLARQNLHVVVGAQVSRVIKTGIRGGLPAFNSVEFRSDNGPLVRLTASKEVILSAGAIGSPHILLNSGIGDARALQSLGITPLVDLPDVGENLADHPFAGGSFSVTGNSSFDDINRDPSVRQQAMEQWVANKTGPMVNGLVTHMVFSRLDENILKGNSDPTPGLGSPHYELLIVNGLPLGPTPPTGHFVVGGAMVLHPTSRGSVKLRSSDPFDAPIIDPGLLRTEFDRLVMREAIKSVKRFFAAPAWAGYVIGPANGFERAVDDASIDEYVRNTTTTIFHPVGTAAMSARGARGGVVDPDLRVKGVTGLRVVDVSVLPFEPSGHTQTLAYVFGERASDLIKAAYPN